MLFQPIFSSRQSFTRQADQHVVGSPPLRDRTSIYCSYIQYIVQVSVMSPSNLVEAWTIQTWMSFLQDKQALLRHPGAHHKVLVDEAHALHRANLIDRDGLSDLLEQADGALAYAVEALLDEPGEE